LVVYQSSEFLLATRLGHHAVDAMMLAQAAMRFRSTTPPPNSTPRGSVRSQAQPVKVARPQGRSGHNGNDGASSHKKQGLNLQNGRDSFLESSKHGVWSNKTVDVTVN
jgi:hypothetical protein